MRGTRYDHLGDYVCLLDTKNSQLEQDMKIYLLGPPGAGKTAVSPILRERYGICHINSTELLRDSITSGSDVGIHVKQRLDSGKPVEEGVLADLIAERARQTDCAKGVVLDGLPRTTAQASQLAWHSSLHPDAVVVLNVGADALLRRVSGRWLHRGSGRTYHDIYCPPKVAGVDDITGEPLEQRADDKRSVMEARLTQYNTDIDGVLTLLKENNVPTPLPEAKKLSAFRKEPMIVQIQADQSIAEVWKALFAVLDAFACGTEEGTNSTVVQIL